MSEAVFRDPRLPARFWAKVQPDPASGCWIWTGCLNSDGYGNFGTKSYKVESSHRVSFAAFFGPIADGLQLDHLCRVRACCNPTHLEPVTARVNTLRGDSPHAVNARKTHCPQGHEYTPDNIKRSRTSGRYCRQCKRDRQKADYRSGKQTWQRRMSHASPEFVAKNTPKKGPRSNHTQIAYACSCGTTVHGNAAKASHRKRHERLGDGHRYVERAADAARGDSDA